MIIPEPGQAYELLRYQTPNGVVPYSRWLDGLDRSAQVRIITRVGRFSQGQFGDTRHLGQGFCEARLAVGPGYRVYFGVHGRLLVILLCGGDKATQARDIALARRCWSDYLGGKP